MLTAVTRSWQPVKALIDTDKTINTTCRESFFFKVFMNAYCVSVEFSCIQRVFSGVSVATLIYWQLPWIPGRAVLYAL